MLETLVLTLWLLHWQWYQCAPSLRRRRRSLWYSLVELLLSLCLPASTYSVCLDENTTRFCQDNLAQERRSYVSIRDWCWLFFVVVTMCLPCSHVFPAVANRIPYFCSCGKILTVFFQWILVCRKFWPWTLHTAWNLKQRQEEKIWMLALRGVGRGRFAFAVMLFPHCTTERNNVRILSILPQSNSSVHYDYMSIHFLVTLYDVLYIVQSWSELVAVPLDWDDMEEQAISSRVHS